MPSSLLTTERAVVLKPMFDTGVELAYALEDTLIKLFKAEKATGSEEQFAIKVRPSPGVARGRGVGGDTGGEFRTVGGAVNQLAPGWVRPRVLQSRYYHGIGLDGPVNAAARDSEGSWENFAIAGPKEMVPEMVDAIEQDLFGDGTGVLAVVDDTSATAVVRVSRNRLYADRGLPGARFLREGLPVRVVDPITGAARLTAATAGFVIDAVDPDADPDFANVTLNRVAPTTMVAGDLIVEGDDLDSSFAEPVIGLDAQINNAAGNPLWFEADRTTERGIESIVIDATTAGTFGNFNSAILSRAIWGVHDKVGTRAKITDVLLHDSLYDELALGAATDSGSTHDGLANFVQFGAEDTLGFNTAGVFLKTRHGKVMALGHRYALLNSVFGLDRSKMGLASWNSTPGVPEFLPGYGSGGIWVKRDRRDQYEATLAWYGQPIYRSPSHAFRIDALAANVPNFN